MSAVAGGVVFNDLTLDRAVRGFTLQLDGLGARAQVTSAIAVNPGAVARLVVTRQPVAGASMTVVIAAQDTFGNVVNSFCGPVTIGLKDDPAGGTL